MPNIRLPNSALTFDKRFYLETIQSLVLIGVAVFVTVLFVDNVQYKWQWYRVGQFLIDRSGTNATPGLLFRGLAVTMKISAVSLVATTGIGLTVALLRLSSSFTGNLVAQVFLEGVRNTPLLIQLFFIYFIVAPIFSLSPFTSAIIALSMFEGAYASEIIRGAIISVPRGQWEAAHSLGLSRFDTYRHIVLPQALRQIIPPLTSQVISLIKDSALVSTIAIYDLTMQGNAIVSETFLSFEIWFIVAAIYLVITGSLSTAIFVLERMTRRTR
jgi:polar amino acid transport system permease protein